MKLLTEGYAFSFPTSTPHPQLLIISPEQEREEKASEKQPVNMAQPEAVAVTM
jgi:hypothetical protein